MLKRIAFSSSDEMYPAMSGAADRADATDERCDEGLQGDGEAQADGQRLLIGEVQQDSQDPDRTAERVDERDHPADRNPHERCGVSTLSHGLDALAHARSGQEQLEQADRAEGDDDVRQLDSSHGHVTEVNGEVGNERHVPDLRVEAPDERADVAQHIRGGECPDEREEDLAARHEWPVDDALDRYREQRADGEADDDDDRDRNARGQKREADERWEDDRVAVREVHEPEDLVDEPVADRPEGVLASEAEAVDELLDEAVDVHQCRTPWRASKYMPTTSSAVTSLAGPTWTIRPATRTQTTSARLNA
jgi:hypothetical protein